jgi:hypothetical protein
MKLHEHANMMYKTPTTAQKICGIIMIILFILVCISFNLNN